MKRPIQVLIGLALPIVMAATMASPASAATVSQAYSCKVAGTTQTVSITISGSATKTTTQIALTGVKFAIKNTFGLSVVVNNVKVHVPDPNKTAAPYVTGSAKVASTPAGWTAGHDTLGVFALHKGNLTFANGATLSTAALSAKYTNKGPKGTVIKFVGGVFSFTVVTPPGLGSGTCTPSGTKKIFASVTE